MKKNNKKSKIDTLNLVNFLEDEAQHCLQAKPAACDQQLYLVNIVPIIHTINVLLLQPLSELDRPLRGATVRIKSEQFPFVTENNPSYSRPSTSLWQKRLYRSC